MQYSTLKVTQYLKTAQLEEETIPQQFRSTMLEQFLQLKENLSRAEEIRYQTELTNNPGHMNSTKSSGGSKTTMLVS